MNHFRNVIQVPDFDLLGRMHETHFEIFKYFQSQ